MRNINADQDPGYFPPSPLSHGETEAHIREGAWSGLARVANGPLEGRVHSVGVLHAFPTSGAESCPV